MFLPTGDNVYKRTLPVVPTLLVLANVFVFALECRLFSSGNEWQIREFFDTWGLVPADLAKGQVTGLLTHMFLHASVLHIVGNMFFLWALSGSLEIALGRATLVGFYLLFGVAAALSQAMMDWASTQPMIGASGAVAGLLGAYTILYGPTSWVHGVLFLGLTPVRVSIPTCLFGAGWFGLQMYLAHLDPENKSGVAIHAHIGGFVAGAIVISVFRYSVQHEVQRSGAGQLVLDNSRGSDRSGRANDGLTQQPRGIVPPTCPYCGRSLEESARIADNYARCSHLDCHRIICLDDSEAASSLV